MQGRSLLALALGLFFAIPAVAQEVRLVEKDGVTYREVRRRVQRPVVETRMEERQQTVYREQLTTEVQPQTRTVYAPVTTQYWEGRWQNGLIPLIGQPYYSYHPRTVTHWEPRTQEIRTHVTRREMVPEQRTVNVPVTTRRMVEDEIITRTVVTNPSAGGATVSTGRNIGGVSRLENDPPRTNTEWHSADSIRR